jgi:hypothetical protein
MTDEAFFSNLIYNAYMADVINEIEAEEACYRLSIPYPPEQHNETHRISAGQSANGIRASTQNVIKPAFQIPVR